MLRRIAPGSEGLYSWSTALTQQAAAAEVFGAPISSSFSTGGPLSGRLLALALVLTMSVTSFVTQQVVQRHSGPVQGQAAAVQRLLLYGMPLGLLATGFLFPVGVLVYWTANNLWTLGQQAYLLRRFPPPASPAAPAPTAPVVLPVDSGTRAPRPGARPDRTDRPRGRTRAGRKRMTTR